MIVCGVEEAGRGPVIGPMVMAGVIIDEKDEHKLVDLGVKDSKLLSPARRRAMYPEILKLVKAYKIIILSPREIDECLASEDINLNWLEALTSVKIIDSLKPDKAILDCPSNNVQAYKEYVLTRLEKPIEIISEHKADLKYPVVSAASILAKVTRDAEIEKIQEKIGQDIGSGYPADPKTKAFLQANYDKYDIFRKSWASYKRLIEGKKQSNLGDF